MRNGMLFSAMVTSAVAPQRLYHSPNFGSDSTRPTRFGADAVIEESLSIAGRTDLEKGGRIHVRNAWIE